MAHDKTPRLDAALRAANAVLVRSNKHLVYRLPNGRMLTLSKSRSDSRCGELNALRDLRRALAMTEGQ